jgi:hypothetical protein
MATVTLTPGTLTPPACYPTEQARLDAYTAAILATISGGIQWQDGTGAPGDVALYWLRQGLSGGPGLEPLKWSIPDAAWTRWLSSLHNAGTPGGSSNAYTYTQSPAAPPAEAYRLGATYIFKATFANTGAATLSVDGLTAVSIKKRGTVDLEQNDITSGKVVVVVHDGTNFQMVSPERPAPPPYEKSAVEMLGLPGFGTMSSQGHGLTALPDQVTAYFVCVTAEHGYAVGDRIMPWDVSMDYNKPNDEDPDGKTAYKIAFDAVNIFVTCVENLTSTSKIKLYDKTSGQPKDFTPANWKLRFFSIRYTL